MIRNNTAKPRRALDTAPQLAGDAYAQIYNDFRWSVPETFNMAQACCRRWVESAGAVRASITHTNIAIIDHFTLTLGKKPQKYTYLELFEAANRLSHVLTLLGVQKGDRVAIVMPQRFETAVAYMAVLQMGAVAMPLSMLFGPQALAYRLQDSEAVIAICDESSMANVQSVRASCPALRQTIGVGDAQDDGDVEYEVQCSMQSATFDLVQTKADDGAVLIYTSGTTGQPKGALIPHRALIGNLTGFVASQNWFGFDAMQNKASKAVFWSPADWAWTGGLMDALLPTLYFGRPIVAYRGRFSPDTAFEILEKNKVTHTFLFPTALKAMMKAYPHPCQHFALQLEACMSAGEAVGDAVFNYCRDEMGITVNEMFGQTEINYIVGNCSRFYTAKPGSMGKAYPGHRVAVIDEDGRECADGVAGDVAVHRYDIHGYPDPVFFLGYWKNEQSTRSKFTGDWCRTGDLATRDADGYLWYQGRSDDVFKAAGYRIGPGEIENCLVKHPAVLNAAVVPKPDKERGAVVKAYIVIAPEYRAHYDHMTLTSASKTLNFEKNLIKELQAHVKGQLAPYEYPKEIEFIDALPMTTTGKVQRRVLRLQEEDRAMQSTKTA